jgi:hypothetical protein
LLGLLAASCSEDEAPLAPVASTPGSIEEVRDSADEIGATTADLGTTPAEDVVSSAADSVLDDGEPQDALPDEATSIGSTVEGFDLPTPSGTSGSLEGTFLDLNRFPYESIVSGGPPKDGIPALTNPNFVGASFVEYLRDDDLVLGVVVNGESRAYPHNIGWWHEIVNDRIGGRPISVTFCPLTGTGLVFDAEDGGGGQFQLGVSGLLLNTNLIMYDRRDGQTLYTQIAFKAVSGPRRGETLDLLPVVETTWASWKRLYPQTWVIETGLYNIEVYFNYPYGDYRTNHQYFLFNLVIPLSLNGNSYATDILAKERVLGVRLDGEPKAYPFFAMGERAVINDQVGGVDIAVVWDRASYLAIPYARQVEDQSLTFDQAEMDEFPFFGMRDRETGTLWDVRGLAVEGELAGRQLRQVPAHNSMWFAWVTFWQNTGVWGEVGE